MVSRETFCHFYSKNVPREKIPSENVFQTLTKGLKSQIKSAILKIPTRQKTA